jgi:hypothetical protein
VDLILTRSVREMIQLLAHHGPHRGLVGARLHDIALCVLGCAVPYDADLEVLVAPRFWQ